MGDKSPLQQALEAMQNPLTPDDIAELKAAKLAIPLMRNEIKRAKAAGFDTAVQEKELDETEKRIDSVLKVYDSKKS